jgi:hypothetical protein
MTFSGRVQFRSSAGPSAGTGPPGESEIQRLNPARERRILAATRWPTLAPGSLNLEVENGVLDNLGRLVPIVVEQGSEIVYPAPFQEIPKLRRAYWYYIALVSKHELRQSALVRRAENPVPRRVEMFSSIPLTKHFGLKEGDILTVEVVEPTGETSGA